MPTVKSDEKTTTEPIEIAEMTTIQEVHEEMITEMITETIKEEKEMINDEEETLDHNTTLATLKMDNIYPLEESIPELAADVGS